MLSTSCTSSGAMRYISQTDYPSLYNTIKSPPPLTNVSDAQNRSRLRPSPLLPQKLTPLHYTMSRSFCTTVQTCPSTAIYCFASFIQPVKTAPRVCVGTSKTYQFTLVEEARESPKASS